ncbi:MAG: hypothetical protein AMS27_06265 [Bacteroides sp. SM23_62_1]|nr:MAG: hypothetical protein AMS27_06265 [Bacteroides sp. SM23_62_1]
MENNNLHGKSILLPFKFFFLLIDIVVTIWQVLPVSISSFPDTRKKFVKSYQRNGINTSKY